MSPIQNLWRKLFHRQEAHPEENQIRNTRDAYRIKGNSSRIKMKKAEFPKREN